MEIPSGYAADLLGRRLTLVVGSVFIGLGHAMLLFADGFAGLALFELGLGIGVEPRIGRRPCDSVRLRSGARATTPDAGRNSSGGCSRCIPRRRRVAAVLCSVLMLWSLQAAVYVQVVVGWMPLLIALTLVEPPGERLDRHGSCGEHAARSSGTC